MNPLGLFTSPGRPPSGRCISIAIYALDLRRPARRRALLEPNVECAAAAALLTPRRRPLALANALVTARTPNDPAWPPDAPDARWRGWPLAWSAAISLFAIIVERSRRSRS